MGARFEVSFHYKTEGNVHLYTRKKLKRNRSVEVVVAVLSGVLSETGLFSAMNMKGRRVL